ncbi:MAG TPA: hypothetical protein VLF90_03085 [Patescibacteria group bacterium]|nr:hypothetical protein [Patescibacteria group bacterium]
MYQICISGAAKGHSVDMGHELARTTGELIAKGGHALLTGATMGLTNAAAQAYKQAGGLMSIGISPASSKVEHVMKYRLPTKPYDVILYTAMHYIGRDVLLINSSDAVISIGGRLGTLNEAIIALETHTPIAFLEGGGGTGADIREILRSAGREESDDILFGADPQILIDQLTKILDTDHKRYIDLYE